MIKILKIFFFTVFISSYSFAEQSIAYIDIDNIISKSISGKKLLNELKEYEKIEIKKLTDIRDKLSKKKDTLVAKKNIISKDEFNLQFQELQKEIKKFKSDESNILKNLATKKNKSILEYLTFINPIIQDYMNKNSISILIEKKNIFIARSNYDISEKLIKIIDQNIKEFKIEK